jgi:hypothetical protein
MRPTISELLGRAEITLETSGEDELRPLDMNDLVHIENGMENGIILKFTGLSRLASSPLVSSVNSSSPLVSSVNSSSPLVSSEVLQLELNSETGYWKVVPLNPKTPRPRARKLHSFRVKNKGAVYMFGGVSLEDGSFLTDLWEFKLKEEKEGGSYWTKIAELSEWWKLTVVLDYYEAKETYSRIGLLQGYGTYSRIGILRS